MSYIKGYEIWYHKNMYINDAIKYDTIKYDTIKYDTIKYKEHTQAY